MSQPSIFISTPCYSGKVDLNYHVSMLMAMKFLGENRIPHMFNYAVSTGVDAARSKHATEFLDTPCTHLMMIDDDMAFPADIIGRLLSEDVDIIGVPYRRKTVNPVRFTVRHTKDIIYKENRPHMVEVEGIGTGLMLVKRKVFESLLPSTPAIRHTPDGPITQMFFRHEFIDDGLIGSKTYMSEDYNFCRLAREAGYKIWAYVDEDVAHMGGVAYRGNYADVLEDGNDKNLRYSGPRMKTRLVGDLTEEIVELQVEVVSGDQKKIIAAPAIRTMSGLLISSNSIPNTEDGAAYISRLKEVYRTDDTEKGIMVYEEKDAT